MVSAGAVVDNFNFGSGISSSSKRSSVVRVAGQVSISLFFLQIYFSHDWVSLDPNFSKMANTENSEKVCKIYINLFNTAH